MLLHIYQQKHNLLKLCKHSTWHTISAQLEILPTEEAARPVKLWTNNNTVCTYATYNNNKITTINIKNKQWLSYMYQHTEHPIAFTSRTFTPTESNEKWANNQVIL